MIHGKWYKGTDDLSVLNRSITHTDKLSWHLVIEQEGVFSKCRLTPFEDSFCITDIWAKNGAVLELILRMINEKAAFFGKAAVYAEENPGQKGIDFASYGFAPYKEGILKADKIILPIHCKG